MIEAVGWQSFDTFFAKCGELLEPDGLMLVQAITMPGRGLRAREANRSFINTQIFPGGCLPSMAVMADCVARVTRLRMQGVRDITASYVPTLRSWRERFEAQAARAAALGYDERFRRLWSFYLSYCEAGFAERRIGDVQVLLAGPGRGEAAAGASPYSPVDARPRQDRLRPGAGAPPRPGRRAARTGIRSSRRSPSGTR